MDFLRFLVYAESSVDETIEHLEILYDTGSLKEKARFEELHARLEILGRMLNSFISTVSDSHKT